MKKILTLALLLGVLATPLLALARTASSTKADLSCMRNAVETRDDGVIAAWDDLHEAFVTALTTRKDSVKEAWKETDRKERQKAIKMAWKEYRADRKAAHTAFNRARKEVWKEYKADVKSCRGETDSSEQESADAL